MRFSILLLLFVFALSACGEKNKQSTVAPLPDSSQDNPPANDDPALPCNPSAPEVPPTDPPSEPANPEDPGSPSDPTNPGDPGSPSEPTNPEDPGSPSDPTNPGDPGSPSDPTNPPTDPSDPTENPPEDEPPVVHCPAGFVKLADASLAKTLCIAQFEMKKNGSSVVSEPSGTPYSVNRTEAQNLCTTSFENGRLPTNDEWNKIAQIIKSQGLNWTGGAVGAGALITGLTKRWADPTSVSDLSNGYDQTGASLSSNPEQRRTFYLDSQTVLWDFGGNAWEWVADDIYGSSMTPSFADNWAHNPKDTYWFPVNSPQLQLFFLNERPSGTNYLGYVFGGTNGLVVRGSGTYIYSNEVGIFSADLGSAANLKAPSNYGLPASAKNVGFRCVIEL